ncbi:hypothetical protein GCM10017786_31870 [Amycolatopsis deserti]|uniref:Uncharacterized protein n=1 Tax=Amycolatopsis deserti TaxID=185696 RepID=A0ABQ3IXU4_9PSEU|nr:hypothetical protein [Amycolatopsis deserti]GHE96838.1 hypothetical protein GCM10017786_31870 [Amycolatopsis deserti]
MVEQRAGQQPDEPQEGPEAPTPAGGLPAAGGGSAVEPAQPQLDPEQLRQFQQFQQFQDFLRYQEAQRQGNGQLVPTQNAPVQSAPGYTPPTQAGPGGPPVLPPPYGQLQPAPQPGPKIRAPKWAKRLAGKLLSALLFLIVLIVAGKLAYNHFFPEDDPDLPASQTGGGTYHTNEILSVNPYEAARQVYQQVAYGQPDRACGLFETATQQKFAADLRYPDCREAVLDLKKQVTNMTAYAGSLPFGSSQPVQGTVVRIDSCAYQISGGPALGVFVVTKVGDQWLITGHEPGPRTCAAPATPTSR